MIHNTTVRVTSELKMTLLITVAVTNLTVTFHSRDTNQEEETDRQTDRRMTDVQCVT